jgi:capsular exopolysaccharide synthesis family protein
MNDQTTTAIVRSNSALMPYAPQGHTAEPPAPSLIEVLWRRRLCLIGCLAATLVIAYGWLMIATPIFRGTALVAIDQDQPSVYAQRNEPVIRDDNFLNTQSEVFRSSEVLARADAAVHFDQLQTFRDHPTQDPVVSLRDGSALSIDVVNKSDIVSVAVDSPYPQEAADIANSIVNAYIQQQSEQQQTSGKTMVDLLQQQRSAYVAQMTQDEKGMLDLKQQTGTLSFGNDQANTALQRQTSLSTSLSETQMLAMDLKAQIAGAKASLASPDTVHAFVEGQIARGQPLAGKDLDDARAQLTQVQINFAAARSGLGDANPRTIAFQDAIADLQKQIAAKEADAVTGWISGLTVQLSATQDKEHQLRLALDDQQTVSDKFNVKASDYDRLAADRDRLQKQCDLLDSRIAEITVNSAKAGVLNVRVVEPARPMSKPVKPSKPMTLAAAGLLGWLLGMALAFFREHRDDRLRTPEQAAALLGLPILGRVPTGRTHLGWAGRSSLPHRQAPAAVTEAFRDIRAAVQFGPARNAKALLIASPSVGDGKSTVASNLALALAQAGTRTLLLDCHYRHPVQNRIFDLAGSPGLCAALSGHEKLVNVILPTHVPNLYVLPWGPPLPDSGSLLMGSRFDAILRSLRETFDRIIIDSPPLHDFSDSKVLAASADATLLVVRMNYSSRVLAQASLGEFLKVGAAVAGLIVNDVPQAVDFRAYAPSHPAPASQRMLIAAAPIRPRTAPRQPAPSLAQADEEEFEVFDPS